MKEESELFSDPAKAVASLERLVEQISDPVTAGRIRVQAKMLGKVLTNTQRAELSTLMTQPLPARQKP